MKKTSTITKIKKYIYKTKCFLHFEEVDPIVNTTV